MITISVNNEHKQIDCQCSLHHALELWGYRSATIAVAVNGEFVPRDQYPHYQFGEGDCIDIVAPISGG